MERDLDSLGTMRDNHADSETGEKPLPDARKFDASKVPLELLPFDALTAVGRVLSVGRSKYGAHNWRKGMAWSRLLGAMLRHSFDWAMGEDRDPESGESHMAHAACCALFLTAYILKGIGDDDRVKN